MNVSTTPAAVAGAAKGRGTRARRPLFRLTPRASAGLGFFALLLAIVYPLIDHDASHINTLFLATANAILALGLNVVVGYAGLLDLGYAAFFAIGAYAYGMLASSQFTPGGGFDLHVGGLSVLAWGPLGIHANFWFFLPVVALIAAFFGVMLGAPTLRLRGDYLAIVTLGFGEIVPAVVKNLGSNNIFGWPDLTGGSNSLGPIDRPQLGTVPFDDPTQTLPWFYLGLAVLVLVVFITLSLRGSRLGRAWIAIREDELAASCMGINLTRVKLQAFATGAFFSGFAGMMVGSKLGSIEPSSFAFGTSIGILAMVVLGGMGSIPGVIVGALLISALQYTILDQVPVWLNNLGTLTNNSYLASGNFDGVRYLVFGAILVLTMIFRREGLIPSRRRTIELHADDEDVLMEENQPLYDVREGKSALE